MAGGSLDGHEPKRVWEHFDAINKIPRLSGMEAEMVKNIRGVADASGFASVTDSAGIYVSRCPRPPDSRQSLG